MKKFTVLISIFLLLISCQIQNIDETTTIKEFIEQTRKPKENFFAVIPHHSLVNDEIDEFYKYLSETYSGSKIDNIVVISPNHFNYNGLLAETIPEDGVLCFQKRCIEAYTFNSIEEKTHFFAPVFTLETPLNPPLSRGEINQTLLLIKGENQTLPLIKGENQTLPLIKGENQTLPLIKEENQTLPLIKGETNQILPLDRGELEVATYVTQEHGIGEHIPLIKKYFPEAKFYPLVIKREFKNINNSAKKITELIQREFGMIETEECHSDECQNQLNVKNSLFNEGNKSGNILFVASVDFSHYVDEEFAIEHDKRTVASLNYGDLEGVEVDCPNCLQTIYNLANDFGKNCFNEYKRTSVDIALNIKSGIENTSHIYGDYSVCEAPKTTPITGIIFGKYNFVEDLSTFYEQNDTTKDPKFYYHTPLTGFDIIATTSDKSEDLDKFPFNHFVFRDEKRTFEIRNESVIFYSLSEDDYSKEIIERLEELKQDNTIIVFVYRKTFEKNEILYELAEVSNMVIGVPDEDADFDIYKMGEVEEYNGSMIYHSIGNISNYVIFEVN